MPVLDTNIITDPLNQLSLAVGDIFVSFGQREVVGIACSVMAINVVAKGWNGGLVSWVVKYSLYIILVSNLLKYYYRPGLLGSPYTVAEFLPSLGAFLSHFIDQQRINHMMEITNDLLSHINSYDVGFLIGAWIDIIALKILIWILQVVAFGSIALSYGCIGVTVLVGPLFIPLLLVPSISDWFWGWFQSLLQYSMYRVAASAAVFVASLTIDSFQINFIHGDYSLAHLAILIPKLAIVVFADCWLILRLSSVVSDWFKGSSSGGSNFVGSVASTGARVATAAAVAA